MPETLRAKVFISCGQRKGEREIALEIEKRLKKKHFKTYLAVYDQTSSGFVENIFSQLEDSEYFIFIDFKREKLGWKRRGLKFERYYRGSLFSHQELALALFLKKPLVAFREVGIFHIDGISGFAQVNAIPFSDRQKLPDKVIQQINKQFPAWNSKWKNKLTLELDNPPFDDIPYIKKDSMGKRIQYIDHRIFHVRVKNLHESKPALNCVVRMEKAVDLDKDEQLKVDEFPEMSWAGVSDSAVVIPAQTTKLFDACLFDPKPNFHLRFYLSTGYGNQIIRFNKLFEKSKNLLLTYVIRSENFPPVSADFHLTFDKDFQSISFVKQ